MSDIPRWSTCWPPWFGIHDNVTVVPASDYDALKAELAEAKAVLQNPAKWHQWCDIRVLEQFEAARDEEARECLRVCQDEQWSTPVPEFMEVARAKYNEGISRCIGAIERRIAKREKA